MEINGRRTQTDFRPQEYHCESNEVIYALGMNYIHESCSTIIKRPPSPSALELKCDVDGMQNQEKLTDESNISTEEPSRTDFVNGRDRSKVSSSEKSNAKNIVTCRVLLLNNTEHSLDVNKKVKGRLFFDEICELIHLTERNYFSCSYQDQEGHKVWLDMNKKLCKQIKGTSFRFTFEVKFYPSDFESLQEDLTRYLICLQVQKDVSSGRLPCSFMMYALLGSYLIQSELGDYTADKTALGTSYVKDFQFAPNQSEELLEKVVEFHRTHRTMTSTESDLLYLMNASKLALYGVELHLAKDSEGDLITVGISSSGLLTFRDRLRIGKYVWPRILRVSYRGRYFRVLVRPSDTDESDSEISFKFSTRRIAKQFWRTVVEFHAFFRLKEMEPMRQRFFLPFGSSKLQYSGRMQHQSHEVSSQINRPGPTFDRTLSKTLNAPSKSTDILLPSNNISVVIELDKDNQNALADGELNHSHEQDNGCQESPTVSCSSRLTSSSSQQPPTTPSRCSSRSDSQTVKMQTRTVTYTAPGSDADDFGMLVSAHSHSSRTHTIETTTYQTEHDGVVKTRVERKFLLGCNGDDVDQSTVLADVIRSVADVDPNSSVERIEIETRSETESS